jgi:hypothetical protein
MQVRLTYLRSTVCVFALAIFDLVFFHFYKKSPAFAAYAANVNRFATPIFLWSLLCISCMGLIFVVLTFRKPAKTSTYNYNGIEGTISEFVYVFSLATAVGALLWISIR